MFRVVVCLMCVVCSASASLAGAQGKVFLSGDFNILQPVSGHNDVPVDVGNQAFFSNLLGGGTVARIHDDQGNFIFSEMFQGLDDYYTDQGIDSQVFQSDVDSSTLAGADLLVVGLPDFYFTDDEHQAMRDFVHGGGNIIFMGEVSHAMWENIYINAALAQVGSTMRIIRDSDFDGPYHTITGPQIADDPFTQGVSSFTYAFTSEITAPDGKGLMFGEDGEMFLAYQTIPAPPAALVGLLCIPCAIRRRR
jgi:hypothetical protein